MQTPSTTSHQATLAHNYFTKPRRVTPDRYGGENGYKTSVEKKKKGGGGGGGGAQSRPYGTVTWPIYHRKVGSVRTAMDTA